MMLNELIESLPNTSAVTIKKLKYLEINNYWDLLNYFPYRYENYSINTKIENVQEGETVTLFGKIIDSKYQITTNRLKIQVFTLDDKTGQIELIFYNQPYLLKLLKKESMVSVAGTIERYGKKITMKPKEYELDRPLKHTGRIIPIYPEKKGISSKTIREKIFYVLKNEPLEAQKTEFLPKEILDFNHLCSETTAYKQIHFPESENKIEKSKERLSFDELFLLQLSSTLIKKEWSKIQTDFRFQIKNHNPKIQEFIKNLPFKLTNAQVKVWHEVEKDLIRDIPMNRLLQGDVGSGKTVIAALSAYLTYLNGFNTLFMAPTEILANQHFESLKELFKNTKVKINIKTSSNKNKEKLFNSDLVVGTQALITKNFFPEKIGLVIVDEQHRFGVTQRTELKNKGINPHILSMTATPIPRTVALTFYGELNLSIIDEMPKNRLHVKTFFVPKSKRLSCYEWIKRQITEEKSQIFIVCPLIDESNKDTMKTIKAAKNEFINLSKIFTGFSLGLLHGKMKPDEKKIVMEKFNNNKINILVSTPVVEVGVDIPNATVMIIEGAERFGLAQLHQLRGRVGRGAKQSFCFLFSENETQSINNRLNLFLKIQNGNELAEEDLKLRGPGDLYGVQQHGYFKLKIANLLDFKLIEKTKKASEFFIQNYSIENFDLLKTRIEQIRSKEITNN